MPTGRSRLRPKSTSRTSRAIDEGIVRLRREREGLLNAWRQTNQANSVIASVRQFCAAARARFDTCDDLDGKRAFLRDYVEAIVCERGNITIHGTIALPRRTRARAPFPHRGSNRKGFQKAVGAR